MRDYYSILGVSKEASHADIKHAFRKLAMRYHPDRNLGNEKWAEEKFKEINESYAVLGDELKRREYDRMRQAGFTGYSTQYASGSYYNRERVFEDAFANPYLFQELARMFQEAGLRFDERFVDNLFFGGKGFTFAFSGQPAEKAWFTSTSEYKPPLLLRLAGKVIRFTFRKMLGVEEPFWQRKGGDLYQEICLSREEAASGADKKVKYKRGREKKKLIVKVPPGVTQGTKIRLRGMGLRGETIGDLLINVKIRG